MKPQLVRGKSDTKYFSDKVSFENTNYNLSVLKNSTKFKTKLIKDPLSSPVKGGNRSPVKFNKKSFVRSNTNTISFSPMKKELVQLKEIIEDDSEKYLTIKDLKNKFVQVFKLSIKIKNHLENLIIEKQYVFIYFKINL